MQTDQPISLRMCTAYSTIHRLILFACLALATACSSQASPNTPTPDLSRSAPSHPTKLVWARAGDAESLDPHRSSTIFSWHVLDQMYDTLLAFGEDGQLVSNLAKDWLVSADGKTITFVLHEDIVCHDGTPFDADDVKFTADRALNADQPSLTQASWGPVSQVEIADPLTVKFSFTEPFAAFLPFMADPFASMICDSNAELGDEFGTHAAIGTGPWQLLSRTPGYEIVLERNPDYVKYGRPVANPGAPYLEQLVIHQISESYTRLSKLQDDEVQLISDPPLDEMEAIAQDPHFKTVLAENTGQAIFLQFTLSRPPFNDIRARQAIAHAIDPDAAIASAWGGWVTREKCPAAGGMFGNDPDVCDGVDYAPDPEAAKAYLAELGYSADNPLEVTLITWLGDNREKIVDALKTQLSDVGISADVEIMDISTMNSRVKLENQRDTGKGMFNLMGWAWYDPDILYALWHSSGAYEGYHSDELDSLLEKTRTTMNPDERLVAVQHVQTYLLKNVIMIPVYTPGWSWIYASKSDIEGFKIGRFNRPLFNDVRIKHASTPDPQE
ncbi:MAG: ABC transporter substrate-binding protein [Elainellaceae cyanobacterium]